MHATARDRSTAGIDIRRGWLAGCILTVATGIVLAQTAPWGELTDSAALAWREPATLALVAALYSAAFWLRAATWRILLATPAGIAGLFSNLQTSLFLNHALPFKAGEISRPLLASRHGMPAGEAFATSFVARALDFVCLAAIALVMFPALWSGGATQAAGIAAVGAAVAGVAALAALRSCPPLRGPGFLAGWLRPLQVSLQSIPVSRVALAAPVAGASWLLESAVLLGAAHLLGIELSLQAAAGVTAFTILFQAIHVTPGGIGVYETAMTAALASHSIAATDALGLAVLTHGIKFAYSFGVGGVFAAGEGLFLIRGRSAGPAKAASRFEVTMARAWNVVNEGKPFTLVFTAAVTALLSVLHVATGGNPVQPVIAIAGIAPLAIVLYRFDFPLRLRAALWTYLAGFIAFTGTFAPGAVALVLSTYFAFTVLLWGTVYYHLRIGTPWTNGFRFVRLVAENPDSTSGNFLEQAPKLLLLVLLFEFGLDHGAVATWSVAAITTSLVAVSALLLHQWFFTWVPPLSQPKLPIAPAAVAGERRVRRIIAIVIDGCRADRLVEARTPFIDRLRAAGIDVQAMSTVYPARTVTCFSSMLTGAPPSAHGMRSNFVPNLSVKCESVFDMLREAGLKGKLVGIAHLIDAFGERDVESVTAVMDNDEIDTALVERARRTLLEDDPDLLVLQLLSVDQTGHARGSYNPEYLARIEETDRIIAGFMGWCRERGYLDDAMILLTADHGQGIGIGGHGHMSPSEIRIPCILAGAGVPGPQVIDEPRSITDVAATISAAFGLRAPELCVGRDLLEPAIGDAEQGPVVFMIPARNEETRLSLVLQAIAESGVADSRVIVVDDGSSDGTAAVARESGAIVVSHERSRGLGAAVRTGLAAARSLSPRAVVYLDGDGEYDAREARALLAPIERGEADYVLGSRFTGRREGMTRSRSLANRAFSALLSVCCRRRISDGQTGFRAFSPRALAVAEVVHDYNYAQVLTMDLLRKGMRMAEVPISYRRRPGGRSFVSGDYLWRVPVGMVREMLAP